MVNFAPMDIASTLSSLIPNSRYKKYGSSRVVVFIPGGFLKGDQIIAVLKGRYFYSQKKWKINDGAKSETVVKIEFEDKKYLNEQNVKQFSRRSSQLSATSSVRVLFKPARSAGAASQSRYAKDTQFPGR